MQVYIDGHYLVTYTFSSDRNTDIFLAPLGVRLGRIKFKLYTLIEDKRVRVKEFGYSFSDDSKEPLGMRVVASNFVIDGYGRRYGRSYGRN